MAINPRAFKIGVTGGRDYTNTFYVHDIMTRALNHYLMRYMNVVIVHGNAAGLDTEVDKWCALYDVPVRKFPAKWKKYHRAAGPMRNKQMLDYGIDILIAFNGGDGTKDMIKQAEERGVKVFKFRG